MRLNNAANRVWDAVVIGAGPAGALAAHQLATRGANVLLVDQKQFPRWKVCGACINGNALSILKQAELTEWIDTLPSIDINRFQLYANGGGFELPIPDGIAVSRTDFDAALVRLAINAGAEFLPSTRAALGTAVGDFRNITLHGDASSISSTAGQLNIELQSRCVLAATGLSKHVVEQTGEFQCRVARGARLGIGAIADAESIALPSQSIHMAVCKTGYVGMVQLNCGSWNIAAAVDRRLLQSSSNSSDAIASVLRSAGISQISVNGLQFKGTVDLTRSTTPIASGRTLLLGDSVGYIEPFTGEGIAWALESGWQAAQLFDESTKSFGEHLEAAWIKSYGRTIRRRQRLCRIVSRLLRSSIAIRSIAALLRKRPQLATSIVDRLNSQGKGLVQS